MSRSSGLTEVDDHPPIVDENVVHLQVGSLARCTVSKLDEPEAEAVHGDVVFDDLAANHFAELGEDQFKVLFFCDRMELADEENVLWRGFFLTFDVPKLLLPSGEAKGMQRELVPSQEPLHLLRPASLAAPLRFVPLSCLLGHLKKRSHRPIDRSRGGAVRDLPEDLPFRVDPGRDRPEDLYDGCGSPERGGGSHHSRHC